MKDNELEQMELLISEPKQGNKVITFPYLGRPIRVLMIDGKPWWVATDVCKVLGLENSRVAVARIPTKHVGVSRIYTSAGSRTASTLSESGLYRLTLRCDKPAAEPFMEWVTEKVLPKLRQASFLLPGEAVPAAGELIEDPLLVLQQTSKKLVEQVELNIRYRAELERTELRLADKVQQIQDDKPYTEYGKLLMPQKWDVPVTVIANQCGQSARAFNDWLIERGVVYRKDRIIHPAAGFYTCGVWRRHPESERTSMHRHWYWNNDGVCALTDLWRKAHGGVLRPNRTQFDSMFTN